MSIYIDKMKDLLDANTAIAIQQLENDSDAGNLEATYLLGKVYFDGIYAAPTADRFIPLWEKEHQITLIVSVLWVTAISLALGILKAMKKPLRFTMKSYGETPTIIRHYARLVVCTVTDGDLHKISPTLLPCLKMHGEKVLAELRQKSVCCICLIWKNRRQHKSRS